MVFVTFPSNNGMVSLCNNFVSLFDTGSPISVMVHSTVPTELVDFDLDFKSSFHQIKVSDDSIPYTSFVTSNDRFVYIRMPFGLRNALIVFQRFINHVSQSFIRESSVVVYMDDLITNAI